MKISFFDKKLKKAELKIKIKQFAKQQGVNRVVFSGRAKFINGSYSVDTSTVFLSSKLNKKTMLCTFFHELSHHLASKEKRWVSYHYDLELFTDSKVFLLENAIDKKAKQLWNQHVSLVCWGKYEYSYPLRDKKNLLEWIKQYSRKTINQRTNN